MRTSKTFWNKAADRYSKSAIADPAAYEKKLELTRGHFTPEMELLEIGCGTGSTALLHAPHVKHIRATDISENMLTIAREKAEATGVTNITFECASVDDLEVANGSLDMVLALSILHLLPNRQDVIRRAYAMLRPGGLLITSTVCLSDGYGFLKFILPVAQWLGQAPYVDFLTAKQLEAEVKAAGFEIEHNWRPGPKKAVFMVLRKPAA
ncbi:class I SAM-dependent methyltransferase [Kordiimonas aestuarii]|uniref:class I SAM-dependent methyltransferase n=1 Tax=Kordiimonas aestuarii TaxID=1005925 RepID=UPI0021D1F45A|nr:class I SAM-dependent methyltransferase [Kordiimonas aestuarii]